MIATTENDTCSSCGDRPACTYGSTGAPYCAGCAGWIFSGTPHPDDLKSDDGGEGGTL